MADPCTGIKMESIEELQEELKQWKMKIDDAKSKKGEQRIDNMNAREKLEEVQKCVDDLEAKITESEQAVKDQQDKYADELLPLQKENAKLKAEICALEQNLEDSKKSFEKTHNTLMVDTTLPSKNVNFRLEETTNEIQNTESTSEPMDISYTCNIVAGQPYVLKPGQAIMTFEEEKVAKSITNKKHTVEVGGVIADLKAEEPQLDRSVKFEINMNISNKRIKVSNLPVDLPEETLKDKVELAFYKSDIGGSEIERVEYDQNTNSAQVTYLHNKVPQEVLKTGYHKIMVGGLPHRVQVDPCVDVELNKLQMFTGISTRSVLLSGIKDVQEDEDDVQDMIQIHFQKESNGGGEVENIIFCQEKKKQVLFEEDVKCQ